MTKPYWFKLIEQDPTPVESYRPIKVLSLILAIGVIGVFFLFPQKSAEPCINPTVVVQTPAPIAPIQMPSEDEDDDD